MKTHRVCLSVVALIPAPVLLLVMTGYCYFALFLTDKSWPERLMALLGLVAAAWYCWSLATSVHTIRVHDDGLTEWMSFAKTVTLRPEQILAVAPSSRFDLGYVTVSSTAGELHVMNQITGFHEVLEHIRKANPTADVKGC